MELDHRGRRRRSLHLLLEEDDLLLDLLRDLLCDGLDDLLRSLLQSLLGSLLQSLLGSLLGSLLRDLLGDRPLCGNVITCVPCGPGKYPSLCRGTSTDGSIPCCVGARGGGLLIMIWGCSVLGELGRLSRAATIGGGEEW
jgi:hypothetical protein